jgi:hypothetical protein
MCVVGCVVCMGQGEGGGGVYVWHRVKELSWFLTCLGGIKCIIHIHAYMLVLTCGCACVLMCMCVHIA